MRSVIGLAAAVGLGGCATYHEAQDHVFDGDHPWHAYPAYAATVAGSMPMAVVYFPFSYVLPDGQDTVHGPWPDVVRAPGLLLGGVFYALTYPLEWVVPDEPPPHRLLDDPMRPPTASR
jgi:hypothetical protein